MKKVVEVKLVPREEEQRNLLPRQLWLEAEMKKVFEERRRNQSAETDAARGQ